MLSPGPAARPVRRATKQIIMITDGEPTAHIDSRGNPFFSYPAHPRDGRQDPRRGRGLHPRTDPHQHVHARCVVGTHPLHRAPHRDERRSRLLHHAETLGDYVLVDFVEHRRKLLSSR